MDVVGDPGVATADEAVGEPVDHELDIRLQMPGGDGPAGVPDEVGGQGVQGGQELFRDPATAGAGAEERGGDLLLPELGLAVFAEAEQADADIEGPASLAEPGGVREELVQGLAVTGYPLG